MNVNNAKKGFNLMTETNALEFVKKGSFYRIWQINVRNVANFLNIITVKNVKIKDALFVKKNTLI